MLTTTTTNTHTHTHTHRVELVWQCQIPNKDDAACFEKTNNATVRNLYQMPVQNFPKLALSEDL